MRKTRPSLGARVSTRPLRVLKSSILFDCRGCACWRALEIGTVERREELVQFDIDRCAGDIQPRGFDPVGSGADTRAARCRIYDPDRLNPHAQVIVRTLL